MSLAAGLIIFGPAVIGIVLVVCLIWKPVDYAEPEKPEDLYGELSQQALMELLEPEEEE